MMRLDLTWRELVRDAGFTEAPVDLGDAVAFTSINRGRLYRVALDGSEVTDLVETGGGPNGLAVRDGEIWVAQNGGAIIPTRSAIACPPSIQRVAREGRVEVVAKGPFTAPNDLAFGPDGRLYVTDPAGSTKAERPRPGRVWALDPATGEAEVIAEGLQHPNGLAFGPDPDDLFVAETLRHRIVRLRRTAEGWRFAGVFHDLEVGEPDGLAFDTAGRLWVATSAGNAILAVDPDGRRAAVADLGPSFPTNLCFAGPDLRTLVATLPKGGRVLAAEASVPGLKLRPAPLRAS